MATRIKAEAAAQLVDETTGRIVGFRSSDGSDTYFATLSGEGGGVASAVSAPAGTAAAPSISFAGDTNTGLYSSSADVLGFAVGGGAAATLTASGNFTAAGQISGTNHLLGASNGVIWGGRSIIASPGNGTVRFTNQAENGFTSLQLGPVTAAGFIAFPAATTTSPHANFAPGVAPSSPVNGDFWVEASDIKVRLGGVTYTLSKT